MNENRRQILEMLAAGKITADEAERLLAALDPDTAKPVGGTASYGGNSAQSAATRTRAKYPAGAGGGR